MPGELIGFDRTLAKLFEVFERSCIGNWPAMRVMVRQGRRQMVLGGPIDRESMLMEVRCWDERLRRFFGSRICGR